MTAIFSTQRFIANCIVLFHLFVNIEKTAAQAGNMGVGTALPGSKLTVNGSFAAAYKTIDADVTLDGTDYYYAINATAARTVTLPTATAASPAAGNILGRTYHIKNTGSFNVTIQTTAPELLDNQSGSGVSSITLVPGQYVLLISKGTTGATTTWEVVLIGSGTRFLASMSANGTQTLITGTTVVNFQALDFETITGKCNLAAGSITIPRSGLYQVIVNVGPNDGGTTCEYCTAIRKNGVTIPASETCGRNGSNGNRDDASITKVLNLAAGDVLTVSVGNISTAKTILTGASFQIIEMN